MDDVTRGVCMAPELPGAAPLLGWGQGAGGGIKSAAWAPQRAAGRALLQLEEDFAPGDRPPALPADPCFKLEPTAIRVRGAGGPAQLGNMLVGFLRDRADVLSMKVRREKFSIRAALSGVDGACRAKVRVYATAGPLPGQPGGAPLDSPAVRDAQARDVYAVEAQRRGGDAVAFAAFFRDLSDVLRQRCSAADSGAWAPMRAPAPPSDSAGRAAVRSEDLEPLCDVAEDTGNLPQHLRCEAASAFARLANDHQTVGLLNTTEGLRVLKGLLQTGQDDVRAPLTEALRNLEDVTRRAAQGAWGAAGPRDRSRGCAGRLWESADAAVMRIDAGRRFPVLAPGSGVYSELGVDSFHSSCQA
mmetsp:Transcript_92045/g.281719  ORF Transcript_92045/g.281719 Transcript_92045/m.281719 type:complete len:358 (-) Transcript_92045:33-1106(-)